MKAVIFKSFLLFAVFIIPSTVGAQPGGGCSPATTNGTCATAVVLTVDGPCVNGTTCGGGIQAASTCLFSGSQCSWYSFTATAANMYVNIQVTANSGCHISSNVYRATGNCTGLTQLSCQSGAPLDDLHLLTGLTIGALHYVQVCYSPGGPCGNGGSAQFCIEAGVPDPPCNSCASPCGTATGYTSNPPVQQVVDDCNTSPFVPAVAASSFQRFCYNFTATNPNVSFNVIITSNCSGGNVSGFAWDLYNYPSCGSAIQSGTLASLSFTGLTIGNDHVFCYSFTVPSSCTHSQHCPYFVGAVVPLPVTWLGLEAHAVGNKQVAVDWITATERNNDHFTVERSLDGVAFQPVGRVDGAGDSYVTLHYRFMDDDPFMGLAYYRVRQTDHDGTFEYSQTVSVALVPPFDQLIIMPNPVKSDAVLRFNAAEEGLVLVEVFNAHGGTVWSRHIYATTGLNMLDLGTSGFMQGIYFLSLGMAGERRTMRFIKDGW